MTTETSVVNEDTAFWPPLPAPTSAPKPVNRDERFSLECARALELFSYKNAEYGNTIVETGVLGASVELIGAVSRLKKLVLRAPDHGEANAKKLEGILMDIHNYANIALQMLHDENFSGVTNDGR